MAAGAGNENLLYVSDPLSNGVFVYWFRPASLKLVGFLNAASYPAGECVDRAQDVYITDSGPFGSREIFEYAHGGTSPIAALSDPAGFPNSCSVDGTTGDLAVTSFDSQNDETQLLVYKKARGKPKVYSGSSLGFFEMYFCGYDKNGNLFVDGIDRSGSSPFLFAALAKGSRTLTEVTLNQSFDDPGGVQWDGKHVAVGDSGGGTIYEFDISGSTGTEVGSTPLTGTATVNQFFIEPHYFGNAPRKVIDPGRPGNGAGYVKYYDYPAGGRPTRKIAQFSAPYAAVISQRCERLSRCR